MFDLIFLLFGVVVFIVVVFGFEGGFMWWKDKCGFEVKWMEWCLCVVLVGGYVVEYLMIFK